MSHKTNEQLAHLSEEYHQAIKITGYTLRPTCKLSERNSIQVSWKLLKLYIALAIQSFKKTW